jgi:hypothetical protein
MVKGKSECLRQHPLTKPAREQSILSDQSNESKFRQTKEVTPFSVTSLQI